MTNAMQILAVTFLMIERISIYICRFYVNTGEVNMLCAEAPHRNIQIEDD